MSPLAGVTVLDVGNLTAGPLTSWLLGSLGADVIKIESPSGDLGRSILSDSEPPSEIGGYYFHSTNADKRSVVLDLKTEAGRESFLELIPNIDVLVENFRPGTMDALGLGYDALHDEHDSLIYCSITGYGQETAAMEQGAYDSILQALSGLMYATGYRTDPPTKVGPSIVDNLGSYAASVAILGALVYRDRTGSGQSIDIALHDCAAWLVQTLLPFDSARTNHQPTTGPYPLTGVFTAANGTVLVTAPDRRSVADVLEHVLGLEPGPSDRERLENSLAEWLEEKPVHEARAELEQVEVYAVPVASIGQVVTDSHLEARGSFGTIDCQGEQITIPVSPYRTALVGPDRSEQGGPALGEHTDEVLAELAGYGANRITALRDAGAIK